MGNMSYCRFENTARDLRDCVNAIQNGETDDLSRYEIDGLKKLLDDAESIVNMKEEIEDIIKENGQ